MTQTKKVHIALIGCGKMGLALLSGWHDANLLSKVSILDPADIETVIAPYDTAFHVKNAADLDFNSIDWLVLAVKPQVMDMVCQGLKKFLPSKTPVLSIAAGKSLAYFADHLTTHQPVIRAMPNTPAAIGKGISVLVANHHVGSAQKEDADQLLRAAGKTLWIEEESLMDVVTALSGSGPAYLFYFIEALARAGEACGLEGAQAQILARQTVIGAAALADEHGDIPVEILRHNVTSKGGTTEAALKVLIDGRFQDLLQEAVQAARDRSQDLAN